MQLLQDPRAVHAHRLGAEHELLGDLGQLAARCDLLQGLQLAFRQAGVQLFALWRIEVVDQHLGHFGRDVLAPLHHGADGRHQFGGIARLVQVPGGARPQAADGVLVFRVHRHHQSFDARPLLLERGQHFQPAPPGHVQVQHQHIAGLRSQLLAQLGIAARLSHDLHVHRLGNGVADTPPHHGMVVTQNHFDHRLTLQNRGQGFQRPPAGALKE